MIVRVKNNLDQIAPSTLLSFPETAGASSWKVQNINPFTASWAVQAGNTGEEQTEIKVLSASAPSGTAISLTTNATYDHPADTQLFAIKFDQVIFKRSTSGTAGTALSVATVNITPNLTFTQYDDTSGAVTTEVSADSDWLTPAGYSFYSLAKLRQRVKNKLFDSGFIKDDSTIDDWINEWMEILNGAAIKVNKDYLLGTTTVGFGANVELGTITATDFKEARRVDFTNDGVSYFMGTKMDSTGFLKSQVFNSTHPYFFYQGDTVIGRRPYDTASTALISYYKVVPVLVNDTDELPTSMHLYTKSFVDWAVAQALWVDGKEERAQVREKVAYAERDRFISEITPRADTNVVMLDISEPTSGADDEGWY
jgi:hypothetical protein